MGIFDGGREAWEQRLGLVRDAVRQDLVAEQIAGAMAQVFGPDRRLSVLDVGCGQGTQAIRLARAGHQVLGLDVNTDILRSARAAASSEPAATRGRLSFEEGDLADVAACHADEFDVVCCHGVAMYLPTLQETVDALGAAVRRGGMVSLLTRNQAGIAMRAGMSQAWTEVPGALESDTYDNRLGICNVRADTPTAVSEAFGRARLAVLAWYGVRLFTDHWGDVPPPDDYEALLAAERAVSRRDPYRQLSALTHTIARRTR